MTLQVYNTLSRRKESFATVEPGTVRMYVCGPTVYGPAHVGHAYFAICFDVIRRYLEHTGYRVLYAQNFTDVDDKIIHRARELGIDPGELARDYMAAWKRETEALGVLPATYYPRATEEIGGMIAMIERLIARGFAYPAAGDVYYRVRRFPEYGKLSHRDIESLRSGARVEIGPQKEDPLDFALWKAAKEGEVSWSSPWGPGRPGWHIECSVMSLKYLGRELDIHGGGSDLIFPHHENEIAQSEADSGGRPLARYWLHNEMVQLGAEKMSKSLGNLVTIEELLAGGVDNAQAFRFMVLTGHYRTPLTWSDESFASAQRGLKRLRSSLREFEPDAPITDGDTLAPAIAEAGSAFHAAMDDDFNTASALAALLELGRAINRARDDGVAPADLMAARRVMHQLSGVLGLDLAPRPSTSPGTATPFIELLVETRSRLRALKQFALGDEVRDKLHQLGVVLDDAPNGTTWRFRD